MRKARIKKGATSTQKPKYFPIASQKKSLTPSTGLVTAHIILGQTMQLSNLDILHHGMQVMFLIKDTQEPQRPMTMPKQTSDSSQKLRQQRNNPMTAAIIRQTEVTLGTMGPGPFQPRSLPWPSLPGALPFSPLGASPPPTAPPGLPELPWAPLGPRPHKAPPKAAEG